MKILSTYIELARKRGGSAKSTSKILLQLANQGLRPTIVDSKKKRDDAFPEIEEYIRRGLIKSVEVPTLHFPPGYWFSPFMINVLRNANPDIIDVREFHNWFSDIALIYGIIRKKKIVFSPHGGMSPILHSNDFRSALKKVYDRIIGRLYIRFVSVFVSNSYVDTKEMVEHWGIDRKRIVQIPHGVEPLLKPDQQKIDEIRQRFNIDGTHLMFFGRLHWRKGIQYLLNASRRIMKTGKLFTITITGPDDGMKENLESLCKVLDIEDHVVFTNFLSRADLISLIASADIIVNPSNYENFGHSLAEATTLGKPIIQSFDTDIDNIELPFVKNGVNGFLIRYGDVNALADAILKIIDDNDLCKKLGENSKILSTNFESWEQVGIRYKQLYKFLFDQP
ncbi:MAG: glycosyltransferase family 4 protein [Candidatus Thorarchaeota archaeon]